MNTTFIIPVRIESNDRARNFVITTSWLLNNTDSQIIVKEAGPERIVNRLMPGLETVSRVKLCYENESGAFHRTRHLNDMLDMVETEVVSNYDIDVLLRPETYQIAERHILDKNADVVYPYLHANDSQEMVFLDEQATESLIKSPNMESLSTAVMKSHAAHAGFCCFARTADYKSVGGEIEEFISYGPEDSERLSRFEKMGLRVGRLTSKVYHLEHSRTPDSTGSNPFFSSNESLQKSMISMHREEMKKFLESRKYVNDRGWEIR